MMLRRFTEAVGEDELSGLKFDFFVSARHQLEYFLLRVSGFFFKDFQALWPSSGIPARSLSERACFRPVCRVHGVSVRLLFCYGNKFLGKN